MEVGEQPSSVNMPVDAVDGPAVFDPVDQKDGLPQEGVSWNMVKSRMVLGGHPRSYPYPLRSPPVYIPNKGRTTPNQRRRSSASHQWFVEHGESVGTGSPGSLNMPATDIVASGYSQGEASSANYCLGSFSRGGCLSAPMALLGCDHIEGLEEKWKLSSNCPPNMNTGTLPKVAIESVYKGEEPAEQFSFSMSADADAMTKEWMQMQVAPAPAPAPFSPLSLKPVAETHMW